LEDKLLFMQNREIKLQDFNENNLSNTYKWLHDIELKKFFLLEKEITKNSHLNWFQNYLKDKTQKIFAIYYDNKHVGNIGLKNIDYKLNHSEVWIYIGDTSNHKRGIGLYATNQIKNYCKDNQIKELYCHVAEFNYPSIRMFEKAKFQIKSFSKRSFCKIKGKTKIFKMIYII